jgi:hypothetical protein
VRFRIQVRRPDHLHHDFAGAAAKVPLPPAVASWLRPDVTARYRREVLNQPVAALDGAPTLICPLGHLAAPPGKSAAASVSAQ